MKLKTFFSLTFLIIQTYSQSMYAEICFQGIATTSDNTIVFFDQTILNNKTIATIPMQPNVRGRSAAVNVSGETGVIAYRKDNKVIAEIYSMRTQRLIQTLELTIPAGSLDFLQTGIVISSDPNNPSQEWAFITVIELSQIAVIDLNNPGNRINPIELGQNITGIAVNQVTKNIYTSSNSNRQTFYTEIDVVTRKVLKNVNQQTSGFSVESIAISPDGKKALLSFNSSDTRQIALRVINLSDETEFTRVESASSFGFVNTLVSVFVANDIAYIPTDHFLLYYDFSNPRQTSLLQLGLTNTTSLAVMPMGFASIAEKVFSISANSPRLNIIDVKKKTQFTPVRNAALANVTQVAIGGSCASNSKGFSSNACDPIKIIFPGGENGYTLAFNQQTRIAAWTLEKITAESIIGIPHDQPLLSDPATEPFVINLEDYDINNPYCYVPGPMVFPNDLVSDDEAYASTFLLSNYAPMDPCFYKYWKRVVGPSIREFAVNGSIAVFTGPIFLGNKKNAIYYHRLGNNLAVPDAFFKVIYSIDSENNLTYHSSFIFPNKPIDLDKSIEKYRSSIEEIQFETGILFDDVLQANPI